MMSCPRSRSMEQLMQSRHHQQQRTMHNQTNGRRPNESTIICRPFSTGCFMDRKYRAIHVQCTERFTTKLKSTKCTKWIWLHYIWRNSRWHGAVFDTDTDYDNSFTRQFTLHLAVRCACMMPFCWPLLKSTHRIRAWHQTLRKKLKFKLYFNAYSMKFIRHSR